MNAHNCPTILQKRTGKDHMFCWDDMRFVLQVVNTGSYSAAAKILKVNHTTVARRVSALECLIGVKLLTQTPKGFVLTEEGRAIIGDIETLQDTANRISRKLQGTDHNLFGSVKITMPSDIYKYLLSDAIATFLKDHPSILLNISLTDDLHDLSSRESDLAIRFTTSPPIDAIGVKIASLSHAIYGIDNLSINQESSTGLIVWADEVDIPDWATSSFNLCHIALRVDDIEGMYEAVKSGVGVALMPCYLPQLVSDSAVTKLMDYDSDYTKWELWVINHVDVRNSKKLQVIKKLIIDTLSNKRSYF